MARTVRTAPIPILSIVIASTPEAGRESSGYGDVSVVLILGTARS
jgi:hypothetical protein